MKWILALAAAAVIPAAPLTARAADAPMTENAAPSAASTRDADNDTVVEGAAAADAAAVEGAAAADANRTLQNGLVAPGDVIALNGATSPNGVTSPANGTSANDAVSQQARDASNRAEANAQTTPAPGTTPPIGTTNGTGTDVSADASASAAAEAAAAPELTLSQAIEIALRQNPQRRAALASLQAATARIGTAKSAGKLQVGLDGQATGTRTFGRDIPTFSAGGTGGGGTGGGGFGGGSSNTNTERRFGLDTSETLSVAAQLPLYTGGRVSASTRVARFNAQAQALSVLQVEQTLVLNTTNAYLNVLRGDQLVQVAQSNEAVSQERLRVAQVRFSAGAAARLEVLRAQTDLANARQNRISSVNGAGQARSNFNTLLAQPPETPVRLQTITRLSLPSALVVSGLANATPSAAAGTAPVAPAGNVVAGDAGVPAAGVAGTGATAATNQVTGSAMSSGATATTGTQAANAQGTATATPGASTTLVPGVASSSSQLAVQVGSAAPLTQLQTAAGASNSSLAVSEAQLRAAQAAVELAQAQRKPSIGLNLGSLLRNPAGFIGRLALSVGLGISQTLVSSGRIGSQVAEAKAIVAQTRANIIGQRLGIGNQIEQSLLNLDSAQQRSASADVAVVSAQEAVRAAQLGYSAGVSTSLEVSDAQAALLQAQTAAVNARFDVAGAQAQLASAVGVLTQEEQAGYENALNTTPEAELQRINALQNPPVTKKRKKFLGIF